MLRLEGSPKFKNTSLSIAHGLKHVLVISIALNLDRASLAATLYQYLC